MSRRIMLETTSAGRATTTTALFPLVGAILIFAGYALLRGRGLSMNQVLVIGGVGMALFVAVAMFVLMRTPRVIAELWLEVGETLRLTRPDGALLDAAARAATTTLPILFHYNNPESGPWDYPALELRLGRRQLVVMLAGSVGGWPSAPRITRRPPYKARKEDFLWLARTLCAPGTLADVDFAERMDGNLV